MERPYSEAFRRPMHAHHERVIERLRERFEPDPTVLAFLVVGSVARGVAGHGSDVDGVLVLDDEAYARGAAAGDLLFRVDELADYPEGHAGGHVIDMTLLRDAAERAPEPMRFSLLDAIVVFSRVPEVEPLVQRIAAYPEGERIEKMASFVSQLPVHLAYLEFGERSRNAYVLAQCAVQLVLFGGRLILAHNRMLYPGRKWFLRELERAPQKPERFLALATELLERPSVVAARALVDAVHAFADWPRPPEGEWARYVRDMEENWRAGPEPLAES